MKNYQELVGGYIYLISTLLTNSTGILLLFLPLIIKKDNDNFKLVFRLLKPRQFKSVYHCILKHDALKCYLYFVERMGMEFCKEWSFELTGETPNPLIQVFKEHKSDSEIFRHIIMHNNRQNYISDLFYHLNSHPEDNHYAITILDILLNNKGKHTAFYMIAMILRKSEESENKYVHDNYLMKYINYETSVEINLNYVNHYLFANNLTLTELIATVDDAVKLRLLHSFSTSI